MVVVKIFARSSPVRASSWVPFRQLSNHWFRGAAKTKLPRVWPTILVSIGGLIAYSNYAWNKRTNQSSQWFNLGTAVSCQTQPKVKTKRFSGKVVLITGAAGDIGGATAKRFVEEDAQVILSDLPVAESKLKLLQDELSTLGSVKPMIITADVTDEEHVKEMVKKVMETAGHLDVFFNNAGVQGELRPLHEQSVSIFRHITNVNICGAFICLKYVSQAMIEQKTGGSIVNTASLAGLLGPANMAAYAASKFAVVGMTKTAAKDLARYNIRVNAIAPGIIEGRMWGTQVKGNALCRKRAEGDNSDVTLADIQAQEERMISGTPLKRLGKLPEVASVVAFLSSNDASYLSGITLPIDGGRLP